jgi:hypothetical protein
VQIGAPSSKHVGAPSCEDREPPAVPLLDALEGVSLAHILDALEDGPLSLMMSFLEPRDLTQTAAVSSRLRVEAEHERLRRIEAVCGALPEAWHGGASEVVRVCAKVYDGFGLLRSYPDGSRVVGAGSAASTCEATVYGMPDGRIVGVLQGHKVAVKAVATDGELVATADQKGVIRLHNAVTLAFLRTFKPGKQRLWPRAARRHAHQQFAR